MYKFHEEQNIHPIATSSITVHSEHVVDGIVNTLKDGVILGTVGRGTSFLAPEDNSKFFDKLIFELFALVRM